ncbi:hypothetical protein GCM10027176_36910 [Actinoallomurus bryophytorum]
MDVLELSVAVPSNVTEIDPSVWVDGLEELFAQVWPRISGGVSRGCGRKAICPVY